MLNYSKFLDFISMLGVWHPLNVLLLNAVVVAILPVVVGTTVRRVTGDPKASRLAFVLAMMCPFTLSNSVILVRDGWTALGLAIAVLALLDRKYLLLVASVGLTFYLRGASGALVAGAVAAIGLVSIPSDAKSPVDRLLRRVAVAVIGIVGLAGVGAAVLPQLIAKGVGDMLFREDFLVRFIGSSTPDSTLYAIMTQPIQVRIPLGFVFFFGSPFFKPEVVFVDGVFVPRHLMAVVAFPLVFLFSVRYFVRGAVSAVIRRHGLAIMMFGVFCVLLLIISQASLQLRHKTLVMPLFYVLVGYGAAYSTRTGRMLGVAVAGAFALVQVVFLFI